MTRASAAFDVLIIGSGPSGVHAATEAVDAGVRVALLDVGFTDRSVESLIPAKPFSEIRAADPDQHRYFLGEDPSAVLNDQDRGGVHLTPGRRYMIRQMDTLFPIESGTFLPLQSTGLGGLGISWGANCFALEDFELDRIGIPAAELRPFYDAAALECGISGPADDSLTPKIANLDHDLIQDPLPVDSNAEAILNNYARNRHSLNRRGLFLGQSMLAMLSRPKENRRANPLFDMDYWTDPARSVYRPHYTLEKLKARSNFTHLTGRLALRFEETEEMVTVHCRQVESGRMETFSARKLLLAGGAINSGRLALASFRDYSRKLPILCNRNHWVAAINLSMLGRPARDARHSLSQLTALMQTELGGPDYAVAQFYSYRSLLWFRMLGNIPLPPRLAILFLRLVATAFTCVNIHYSDEPSADRWIQLGKSASGEEVLKAHTEYSGEEKNWLTRNERRLLRFLLKLRCVPLGISRPQHGASIHYAGTLPSSSEELPFTTDASGRLRATRHVYVADGSTWRFLPAKGLTLTLMANARRVARQAVRTLAEEAVLAGGAGDRSE